MNSKSEEKSRPLLILFGAGASHGAREGAKPPLGYDLLRHLLTIYEELKNDRREAFASFFENFEDEEKAVINELFDAIRESVSQRKDYETFLSEYRSKIGSEDFRTDPKVQVLTKILSASMISYYLWDILKPKLTLFPFFYKSDLYDELINVVKSGKLQFNLQDIVFITTNYDVLFGRL
jgi:hypothetical protein